VALFDDGEAFGIGWAREIGLSLLLSFTRCLDLLSDELDQLAGGPAGFEELGDTLNFAADEALVAEHAILHGVFERAEIDGFFGDRFGEALVHGR